MTRPLQWISPTAVALWAVLALCALSPGSVPIGMPGGPAVMVRASDYDPPRVTPADVRRRRDAGEDIVALDVRPEESYKAEHIKGALNAPWRDLELGHAMLPKERLLLLYCT